MKRLINYSSHPLRGKSIYPIQIPLDYWIKEANDNYLEIENDDCLFLMEKLSQDTEYFVYHHFYGKLKNKC